MITKQTWKIGDSRVLINEIENDSVGLIVTSPPYYDLVDYNVKHQIGFGQSYSDYLSSLGYIWEKSFNKLKPNRRMCINVSDIGISNAVEMSSEQPRGNFHCIPLHIDIIRCCVDIGFDYLGSIFWRKISNCNSQFSGNSKFLGSYPYPPNGHVLSEVEYILLFRKRGKEMCIDKELKEQSKLSKDEWKLYFSQIWEFNGEYSQDHPAVYPIELPYRLIKMFSLKGDLVFDPFLGRGTTLRACRELERNGIGLELNPNYAKLIEKNVMNNIPPLESWGLKVPKVNTLY